MGESEMNCIRELQAITENLGNRIAGVEKELGTKVDVMIKHHNSLEKFAENNSACLHEVEEGISLLATRLKAIKDKQIKEAEEHGRA